MICGNAPVVLGLTCLWIGLLLGGLALLFLESWVAGLIALPMYFLVLPLIIAPLLRKFRVL